VSEAADAGLRHVVIGSSGSIAIRTTIRISGLADIWLQIGTVVNKSG
jgi:hypothetical protein